MLTITGTWPPDSLRWIRDLHPQAATGMMDEVVTYGRQVVQSLWNFTLGRAPRFRGDMATAWQWTNEWRQGRDCIWEIESLRSEDPADSMDPATAPFNVAWGKQDGIRGHRAWIAVPPNAPAPTRGRVRRKLAAWAAAHVDSAYAAATGISAADQVIKALRDAGVPPFITVHSIAHKWAYDDEVIDKFEKYMGQASFFGIAQVWEA
jgi:hypothetical protein